MRVLLWGGRVALCVCGGDSRKLWGRPFVGKAMLLPDLDHLRFPLREARAPSNQTGGRGLGPKNMLW